MLMEVKRHFKILLSYIKFNLKCSSEYKISFLTQIFGMILNNGSFLIFWWIIFRNVNIIGGYSFEDVLTLWGLASSSFGLTYILFGNVRELSDFIISGRLDSYILQPADIVLNTSASKMEVSAWGDLIYGYILLLLAGRFDFKGVFLFTLFTVTGSIIYFSLILLLNSLAFYLGNVESTKKVLDMFFLTFATYPEGIFDNFIRFLLYSILPVGFSIYIPIKVFNNFSLLNIILVILAALVWLFISFKVFYSGLKRYESANIMEAKI